MKPMIMLLCAVLGCMGVAVAQEQDWLSGTWKGMTKLVFASSPNMRQRAALNGPGAETVFHLQYNPATKVITGTGEAQNLQIANSNLTMTVLEGSVFDGDKGVLIFQQHGGVMDGEVRKFVMERKDNGSLSGYNDIRNMRFEIQLQRQ